MEGLPFLEIKDFSIAKNGIDLLKDVSLTIDEKDIVGVIGPSGAGKSVFLKGIYGVFGYKGNPIKIRDSKLSKKNARKIMGFATQDPSLYEDLTVKENLEYFGHIYGIPKKDLKQRIEYLVDLLELVPYYKTMAKYLSGGTKKRLNMAISLIHNPKILLLDEPLAGLDPKLRKEILDSIEKINAEGTTILMSSHFINEISRLCSKILILNEGSVLAFDTIDNLRQKSINLLNIKLKSYPGQYDRIYQEVTKYVQVLDVKDSVDGLTLVVQDSYSIKDYNSLLLNILINLREDPKEIKITPSSLEEIFRRIIKHGIH